MSSGRELQDGNGRIGKVRGRVGRRDEGKNPQTPWVQILLIMLYMLERPRWFERVNTITHFIFIWNLKSVIAGISDDWQPYSSVLSPRPSISWRSFLSNDDNDHTWWLHLMIILDTWWHCQTCFFHLVTWSTPSWHSVENWRMKLRGGIGRAKINH